MSMPTGPFNIIVKPIGSVCNLNCEYCYYLEKAQLVNDPGEISSVMTDELLESFTRSYIESQPAGTQEVVFSWQGGEPTILGIPFFEKAVALQEKYARKGLKVMNALQTNATLVKDDLAKFFADHEFLIGVSLDGPEAIHNHYRKYPDGRGSFADVMRGYETMKAAGVAVNTLTVVQHHNGDYPVEVYEFLDSIDSEYIQFIPVVEYYDGRVSDRSVEPAQFGTFLNGVFDRWLSDGIGRRFVQHFDLFLGRYAGYPSTLCVHAPQCGRALALEHNGKLYSCDHFVEPANLLGNIAETPMLDMVESDFQHEFGRSKASDLPAKCRDCTYLQLCFGGCLRNRIVKSGDAKKINYLCDGYTSFFEHTRPYFLAMREALRHRRQAADFMDYFDTSRTGRNDPCPCGSGRKFKNCHGRQ